MSALALAVPLRSNSLWVILSVSLIVYWVADLLSSLPAPTLVSVRGLP